MNVMGTEVEVPMDAEPVDTGRVEQHYNLPFIDLDDSRQYQADAIGDITSFTAENQERFLSGIRPGLTDARAGSLQKLILDLHKLSLASRDRNITLCDAVEDAYRQRYEAALSEERAQWQLILAEHQRALAEQSEQMAEKKTVSAGAGAAVGAALLTGGWGLLFGGALGLAAAESGREEIPEPWVPSEREMMVSASRSSGLGDDPEKGLQEVRLQLCSELAEADLAASETLLSAYEILLRRVMFDYEDGGRLAETATTAYRDAANGFELAAQLWDETDERYLTAQQHYQRAEQHYEKAQQALLLSIVVTGMIQAYVDATSMTTQQYRDYIQARTGQKVPSDIHMDHIWPAARGGANHPLNYQPVPAALNQAWSDGALFEKCLRNPVGFAKATVVSRPGTVGALAGLWHAKQND